MNVGALKDRKYDDVLEEFTSFVAAAGGAVTKCILEVCFLTDEEIATGCKLIAEAGIQYAKTSSGQFEGPSLEQFLVMKDALKGTDVKLKVAGVKFPRPQNAYVFLMAGADRLGTRDAPAIVEALDQLRELGIVPKLELVPGDEPAPSQRRRRRTTSGPAARRPPDAVPADRQCAADITRSER
jgi:deoxyribose-phosphate aldolase